MNLEAMLEGLQGCRHFSKVDLTHAFLQIPLDSASKELTTINTMCGLFRYFIFLLASLTLRPYFKQHSTRWSQEFLESRPNKMPLLSLCGLLRNITNPFDNSCLLCYFRIFKATPRNRSWKCFKTITLHIPWMSVAFLLILIESKPLRNPRNRPRNKSCNLC